MIDHKPNLRSSVNDSDLPNSFIMDVQSAVLDDLTGAAPNVTDRENDKEITWDSKEVCGFYLTRFCPHDLFVNTRSDLGPCPKIHDLRLKESFEKSPRHDSYAAKFDAELKQFCEKLVMDLDRKVRRGQGRLDQELDLSPISDKYAEPVSVVQEKIRILLAQVEILGVSGNVDDAEERLRKYMSDVGNPKEHETRKCSGTSHWHYALLQQASVYGIAIGYCLSASMLSIINKWAVMKFPYPGALTALQYFTSTSGVIICGLLKLIEHDSVEFSTMWRFLPAAIIFYISLFTNSELLLHANVDTFIVFRSLVPIFVAIGETLYLHQPWPTLKTWISLGTIFCGSVLYVLTDYQFTFMAYTWALAYLVSMSIDFVYIKHVVMTIGLNTWGLVLYNNLEALLLFPVELLIMGEFKKIKHEISGESDWYSFNVVLPVGLSCLFGLAISFFGFSCRRAISATGFTVLGIVNKLLTVVINLFIWDKHSTFVGTLGLLICMFGGVMYQQSTNKKPKAVEEVKSSEGEEVKLLEMQSMEQGNTSDKHGIVGSRENMSL